MSTISTGQAGGGRVAATSTLRFALLITGTSGFLDAYTYVERGGVFANAQTANVVLGAVAVSDEHWVQALQHLASIVTFAVGAAVATHLATRQRPRFAPTVEVLATGLLAVTVVVAAFVPASAPPMVVTVPLVFLAAMLTELFRKAGDLPYLPIATTGSLALGGEHARAGHPSHLVESAPVPRVSRPGRSLRPRRPGRGFGDRGCGRARISCGRAADGARDVPGPPRPLNRRWRSGPTPMRMGISGDLGPRRRQGEGPCPRSGWSRSSRRR